LGEFARDSLLDRRTLMRRALGLLAFSASTAALASAAIPDASTPGATDPAVTQTNIHQTICVPGYSRSVRPPSWYTSKLKPGSSQQTEYSLRSHSAGDSCMRQQQMRRKEITPAVATDPLA
jgi:hypothetical protein